LLLQLLVQQQQQPVHHMLLLQRKVGQFLQQPGVHRRLPQHLTPLLCLGSWER
jgi:hypothetical protein